MILVAKGLVKQYGRRKVLSGVSLEVSKGEFVAILGPSGAGKSTLLHLLGALEASDSGHISLEGISYSTLGGASLARFRNQRIGFIFQSHHLLSEFNAWENVALPGYLAGRRPAEVRVSAEVLLKDLGLGNRLSDSPDSLSGGEAQRVAVARALINQPAIVFGDEPTGNLDSKNSQQLYELFLSLRQKHLATFVLATHDQRLAQGADRVLQIKDGVLCE